MVTKDLEDKKMYETKLTPNGSSIFGYGKFFKELDKATKEMSDKIEMELMWGKTKVQDDDTIT